VITAPERHGQMICCGTAALCVASRGKT